MKKLFFLLFPISAFCQQVGFNTYVTGLSSASNLTGAVIPIVQGGVTKKADASLFGASFTASMPLIYSSNVLSIQQATTSQNGYLTNTDWATFNGKQGAITLTTTGTSGAATFIGNTLNIPQYAGTTYSAGTGLTLSTNTFSVNTSQNISALSNLTSNGYVKTSGGVGTLGVVTTIPNADLTNSSITIAGNSTALGGTVTRDNITGLSSTGIIKRTGANTLAIAVSNTDYQAPITFGTGVLTALAVNVGSSGAPVLFNGAGGAPSSITLTNATGLPPTTGISGWPANASGVLTNNGSGTLTWAGVSSSATASTLASRDANANLFANNLISSFNTSATAGGSTTLTVSSQRLQYRTGSANETITMPVTSTLSQGLSYIIDNTANTGTLTINSSGGNNILTMAAGSSATLTCILTSGTTAASWGFIYNPASPLTQVGDLLAGGTVVGGVATPSKIAAGTANYPLVSNGAGSSPTYQLLTANSIVAEQSTTAPTTGNLGEVIAGTAVTTYTNFTTSATYKNIASITLTPGDWIIRATFTLYGNAATITVASDAIFAVSTTTASATGAVEGKSIYYIPQSIFASSSSAHISGTINWHIPQLSGSTTYYLNGQATYSAGNMQYVGHIEAVRPR